MSTTTDSTTTTTISDLHDLIQHNKSSITIPLAHPNQTDINNKVVYFDITISEKPIGRIVIELYNNITPITCNNFYELCIGQYIHPHTKQVIGYKQCIFHRVVSDLIIQGGDILNNDGTGTISIYNNNTVFNDENFILKHDRPGLLSCANSGPNTNNSQFFITLNTASHLDNKHVVFGHVIDGMLTVRKIEAIPVDSNNKPTLPVVISDCGEL